MACYEDRNNEELLVSTRGAATKNYPITCSLLRTFGDCVEGTDAQIIIEQDELNRLVDEHDIYPDMYYRFVWGDSEWIARASTRTLPPSPPGTIFDLILSARVRRFRANIGERPRQNAR
ncbi:MAG: hypothetical protein AAGE92_15080 [Cyanobacteria bacterium P01_G01_bin.4]